MKRPRPSVFKSPSAGITVLWALLASSAEAFPMTSRNSVATGRGFQPMLATINDRDSSDISSATTSRRSFLNKHNAAILSTVACLVVTNPSNAVSSSSDTTHSPFTRTSDRFAYSFQPPDSLTQSNKPLKTHLDEVNFIASDNDKSYQIGITVDPVRINSLVEFGTPAEVAAKVVLAEVNRDGVYNVTLLQDPMAGQQQQSAAAKSSTDSATTSVTPGAVDYYQLDYLSQGKRGDKRFVCKFLIYRNMLYALTAQCRQEDYDRLSSELLPAVESFHVIVSS
jgi:hypothetical protein